MTPAATAIAQNCHTRAKGVQEGLSLLLADFESDRLLHSMETALDLLVDDFADLMRQLRADEVTERLARITERALRSHPRIEESASYRSAMIDAGRGRLLK